MKKNFLWLLAALLLLCPSFTACDPEDDNGGNDSDGKKLSCITLVEEGIPYEALLFYWDKDNISRIVVQEYHSYSGTMQNVVEATPSYDNGRMTGAFVYDMESTGVNISFNYSGDRLMQIAIPHEGTIDFTYNSEGKPIAITSSEDDDILYLTWDNSNISRINTGDGYVNLNYNNTYYNPLNDIFACIFPTWDSQLGCPSSIVSPDGDRVTVVYHAAGDWPGRATIGDVDIYFQYTDGSGDTPPEAVTLGYIWCHAYDWYGGNVEGDGEYPVGTQVTLTAVPWEGYSFAHWQDGNSDNPRVVTVTEGETEYTAYFTRNDKTLAKGMTDDNGGEIR